MPASPLYPKKELLGGSSRLSSLPESMVLARTWYCKDVNLVPCFDLSLSTVSSTIFCLSSYVLFFLLFFPLHDMYQTVLSYFYCLYSFSLCFFSCTIAHILTSLSKYSKPFSHHIRTHTYLLIASIKSHIKIKDCRGPLSQLFLQQSFNSIQRLYIIGMHVPDQVVFIVTSAVWSYHLGGYWWQNKPLCTFGIRLGMRFCCTFTPAVVASNHSNNNFPSPSITVSWICSCHKLARWLCLQAWLQHA